MICTRLCERSYSNSCWWELTCAVQLGPTARLIIRGCWINLKTLLDKTFILFVNQKVPDMGVIGGKIPGLFPWKLGNWPPKIGKTLHPTSVRTSAWDFGVSSVERSVERWAHGRSLSPGKTFCRKPYLITFNSFPQIVLDLFATTSTLKRKLKPSKSTEKVTYKIRLNCL